MWPLPSLGVVWLAEIYLPASVIKRLMRDGYVKEPMDNPVCPRCERVAHRDIGWAKERIGQCLYCGYRGRMEASVRKYIEEGLYK